MKTSLAKKKGPQTMSSNVELPFTQSQGFLTDDEVYANVDDTLEFQNQTSGSGSVTIYVLQEDGQATTGAMLGSSNQSFSVNNGASTQKTVLATGKYLLSKVAPPVDPGDPGGPLITVIVTS